MIKRLKISWKKIIRLIKKKKIIDCQEWLIRSFFFYFLKCIRKID